MKIIPKFFLLLQTNKTKPAVRLLNSSTPTTTPTISVTGAATQNCFIITFIRTQNLAINCVLEISNRLVLYYSNNYLFQ